MPPRANTLVIKVEPDANTSLEMASAHPDQPGLLDEDPNPVPEALGAAQNTAVADAAPSANRRRRKRGPTHTLERGPGGRFLPATTPVPHNDPLVRLKALRRTRAEAAVPLYTEPVNLDIGDEPIDLQAVEEELRKRIGAAFWEQYREAFENAMTRQNTPEQKNDIWMTFHLRFNSLPSMMRLHDQLITGLIRKKMVPRDLPLPREIPKKEPGSPTISVPRMSLWALSMLDNLVETPEEWLVGPLVAGSLERGWAIQDINLASLEGFGTETYC